MDSPISFIDLQAQRRRLGRRLDEAIEHLIAHGRFILGPEVEELEQHLADFKAPRKITDFVNITMLIH